jgi:predicted flavoprotein YhiN
LNIVIDGYGGTDKAQVSSGGVRLSAMNENMQYKGCQGMYITGEALNVDGKCGGYNLQWAWSSAAAAAKGVAESVRVDL